MLTRTARISLIIAAVGLIFFFILAIGMTPGGLELVIAPVLSDKPLLVLPLQAGELFTVRYYHSVENAPIWEVHSVDEDGRIFIEEERYLKFGAGMGRMPGVGRMVRRGPYEVIEGMHMPTGNFILRIGSPGVDHTIIWRGAETNLSTLAPHVAVQFSARPVSALYRAWRMLSPHATTPRTVNNQ